MPDVTPIYIDSHRGRDWRPLQLAWISDPVLKILRCCQGDCTLACQTTTYEGTSMQTGRSKGVISRQCGQH